MTPFFKNSHIQPDDYGDSSHKSALPKNFDG
jgi:hypothetical protein